MNGESSMQRQPSGSAHSPSYGGIGSSSSATQTPGNGLLPINDSWGLGSQPTSEQDGSFWRVGTSQTVLNPTHHRPLSFPVYHRVQTRLLEDSSRGNGTLGANNSIGVSTASSSNRPWEAVSRSPPVVSSDQNRDSTSSLAPHFELRTYATPNLRGSLPTSSIATQSGQLLGGNRVSENIRQTNTQSSNLSAVPSLRVQTLRPVLPPLPRHSSQEEGSSSQNSSVADRGDVERSGVERLLRMREERDSASEERLVRRIISELDENMDDSPDDEPFIPSNSALRRISQVRYAAHDVASGVGGATRMGMSLGPLLSAFPYLISLVMTTL